MSTGRDTHRATNARLLEPISSLGSRLYMFTFVGRASVLDLPWLFWSPGPPFSANAPSGGPIHTVGRIGRNAPVGPIMSPFGCLTLACTAS